jgi:hypothetical protein
MGGAAVDAIVVVGGVGVVVIVVSGVVMVVSGIVVVVSGMVVVGVFVLVVGGIYNVSVIIDIYIINEGTYSGDNF